MPASSDLIVSAAAQLQAAGIDNPAAEARLLIAALLGIDRATLLTDPTLSDPQAKQIAAALTRRARHEPLARILGRREFWSLDFALNAATLVPRPDSETLLETALELFRDRAAPLRILDLGTGSGCLLLALLHEYPYATGLGIDLAPEAVTQAAANAAALDLAQRSYFLVADWNHQDFLSQILSPPLAGGVLQADGLQGGRVGMPVAAPFDLIISNPPYIPSALIPTLAAEVRAYDPPAALDGGPDGLAAYRRLAALLPQLSHAKTQALFEIGYDQGTTVPVLFRSAGYPSVTLRHDLAGQPRCVMVRPRTGA